MNNTNMNTKEKPVVEMDEQEIFEMCNELGCSIDKIIHVGKDGFYRMSDVLKKK